MGKFFDLTAIKLTRAQGAHALELLNQNIKALALSPRSIKQLEQLAKLLLKPAESAEKAGPDSVLDSFDLTSLHLSSAQCFKVCQLFLDNADILELDVDQASVVDEFSQEFANCESEVESQEEEAEVYERHIEDLECVVVNENKKKLCRLYLIGECPFGDLCPLRHPAKEELDRVYSYYASLPCRNFDRCKLKNCLYQHPGGPVKGSIQDQYMRRVVKGGRSTICFKFLSGCCDQTAESCDKIHANADEALKCIQRCRASTCKNGPECRVAGCLFNHSGYPVWYVPKSKDSIWWGRGWDEELEGEKKEVQFWYEGKLREAADYYERKLQELDDWYSAKCHRMEEDIQCIEVKNQDLERQVATAPVYANAAGNPMVAGGGGQQVVQDVNGVQSVIVETIHQPAPPPQQTVYVDKNGQKSTVVYVDAPAQKGHHGGSRYHDDAGYNTGVQSVIIPGPGYDQGIHSTVSVVGGHQIANHQSRMRDQQSNNPYGMDKNRGGTTRVSREEWGEVPRNDYRNDRDTRGGGNNTASAPTEYNRNRGGGGMQSSAPTEYNRGRDRDRDNYRSGGGRDNARASSRGREGRAAAPPPPRGGGQKRAQQYDEDGGMVSDISEKDAELEFVSTAKEAKKKKRNKPDAQTQPQFQ
mmetsp:Transcript_7580/g.18266  ORF Transcript_7580/g.18266 Transcript_7580/m.18266 type:complete len:642 (-) Transcript_7580:641-2566(-)|eukprot:CAMPEP_0178998056 /NCGR_PEP_ID=MMETSP0795-20121207/9317_1 /TAXON_ID=88552 /ORGANISM="Amoebophrya sp., Strain Ameob2" /LENGTH=641 /DNA_ID=CAMNT_0020690725 /DNA_START=288 /DNA_END=2213 /DNA_ORIENTATION=+